MALEPLPPDEAEIYIGTHYVLKPCPFCGDKGPTVHSSVNNEPAYGRSALYQGRVSCRECCASVFYNSPSRDDARKKAIERWQCRPSESEAADAE